MKHELSILLLWAIAISVTFLKVDQQGLVTILGPVYSICMIGSIIVVRAARSSSPRWSA